MNHVTGKKSSQIVTLLFLTVSYSNIFHYCLLENPELLSLSPILLTQKRKSLIHEQFKIRM